MSFKKLIKTVKENHSKFKEKSDKDKLSIDKNKVRENKLDDVSIHKNSKKGIELKDGLFIDKDKDNLKPERIKTYKVMKNDTLRSISKDIFGNEKKWISIHLKNIHKIPNPYKLIESMILDIPYDNEVNNFYDISSKTGNYIVQDKDDIKKISEKIFGTEKLAKKLIEWNFFKFTKDIYPGKEIKGLKYLDLIRQMNFLLKKYNLKNNLSYSDFIIELIVIISDYESIPALVPLLIADFKSHLFLIQEDKELIKNIDLEINISAPMNLNPTIYTEHFPRLSMDIEYNLIYGIKKLKELRITHKNWPKAIVSYFMDSPLGLGRPEEQKIKTKEMIKIIDLILDKMNDKSLNTLIKRKVAFQNDRYINFDLLQRELLDYKNNSIKKYL